MSDPTTVHRLCIETLLGARTVDRVLRGEPVRPATRRAVEVAAVKLGIKLPPSAVTEAA